MNRMLELDPDLAARVPQLRAVVGFRNILAHGYVSLDSERVWHLAATEAPRLKSVIASLLKEHE